MMERGLPVDGAPACPFVAFEHDRDARATSPDQRHRCFAEPRPAPRALAHQEAYCLSSAFPVCPTFQDWARREAASAVGAGMGGPPESTGRGTAAVGAAAAATGFAAAGGASATVPMGPGVPTAPAPQRQPLLRATRDQVSQEPEWPAAPSWPAADLARRHAARTDLPQDEEDPDDSAAPRFVTGTADPGRGLAGSPADRFARSAEPAGARPTWSSSDDGIPRRASDDDDGRGRAVAFGGGAALAGAGATAATASRPPATPTSPGYAGELDDAFYSDRDRSPAARDYRADYGRGDARVDVADRPAREEPRRGGLFGRDNRPKVGDTRREPDEPAWEQPRRYDTYPTLKTRRGIPSRAVVAALALAAAAVGFFLLPGLLGLGNPAVPAGSASVAPSQTQAAGSVAPSVAQSVAPTPEPTPTPLTYTVRRGDTMTRIANRYKVTVDQLLAANPQIKNPNQVNVGDVLVIPTGGALATPTPTP
jgi:hypothetical protein